MASVETQGTTFSFTVCPPKREREWALCELSIKNEFINYTYKGKELTIGQLEELLVSLSRLLAGAYEREYALSFERAGLAVDMYPYTMAGYAVSRDTRQKEDCVAAVRLLMRSKKKMLLGGVYTVLLHRAELEEFMDELWGEYYEYYADRMQGSGRYRFVGVSPRGRKGCNYLYLDETEENFKVGEYAWVRMGRRLIEQVVHIDSVRYYDEENAPYNPHTVKCILRRATAEEIKAYLKAWK